MVAAAPIERRYEPRGGAVELFRSPQGRVSRILMDGPAGTGKTTAILWYVRLVAEKYPGLRVLLLRETRASMSESVLVTFEDKVLGRDHYAVVNGPKRAFRDKYELENQSVFVVGGLDRPEKLFSSEYDIIVVFEAIETQAAKIETLLRALRNGKRIINGEPFHQLIMDTNPGAATHWLNIRANDGWLTRVVSRHKDNPYLWDAAKGQWTAPGRSYMEALEGLTGARRERLLVGKWVNAEGVVYEEFDERTHVISEMPAGWQAWPKYRAIDFGYNDPFVCQWWAVNDGCAYLYREIYMSRRTVDNHAKQINQLSKGEEYVVTVADHDREDRATLEAAGIVTRPAYKADILQGIGTVKQYLRVQPNGRPRLFILRGCTVEPDNDLRAKLQPVSTIEEFDSYVWKRTTDGHSKDAAEDKNNHGMDAMRYALSAVEGLGVEFVGVYFAGGEEKQQHGNDDDDWGNEL